MAEERITGYQCHFDGDGMRVAKVHLPARVYKRVNEAVDEIRRGHVTHVNADDMAEFRQRLEETR